MSFLVQVSRPRSSVWIEQRFPKPFVGGSSPLGGTRKGDWYFVLSYLYFVNKPGAESLKQRVFGTEVLSKKSLG